MAEEPLILGQGEVVSDFVPNYTHDLDLDGQVKFVLTYVNSDGDAFTQEATAPVQLETFSDLGLADAKVQVSPSRNPGPWSGPQCPGQGGNP